MNEADLRHILEFLSPATLAGILSDWEGYAEDPTPQQRQVAALVRETLVANVGERDADAMIAAVHKMM